MRGGPQGEARTNETQIVYCAAIKDPVLFCRTGSFLPSPDRRLFDARFFMPGLLPRPMSPDRSGAQKNRFPFQRSHLSHYRQKNQKFIAFIPCAPLRRLL